jgi:gliding motility-associated-like protein
VCIVNIGTPVVASITPDQSTIFKGESIQMNLVTQSVVDSITWTPTDGLNCADCPSPTASPLTVTTYTASIVDADGCTGSASATVEVVSDENSAFIPTAFTPNDDNLNDILFIRSPKLIALEFRIFDRWGTEVFATKDLNTGWDGRDKSGNEVDVGIYVYYAIVTFDNGKSKTLKGNVGVIR